MPDTAAVPMNSKSGVITPRGHNTLTPRGDHDWDPFVSILDVLYGWLLPCMCMGPLGSVTPRRKLKVHVKNQAPEAENIPDTTAPQAENAYSRSPSSSVPDKGVIPLEKEKQRTMTVIVMRHSERADHSGDWVAHPWDPPLSEKGIKMAKNVAKHHFKELGITKVVCSPFLRCLQTANIVRETLDLDGQFVLDNGLAEVFNAKKCYVESEPALLSAAEIENTIPGAVDWSATRWGHREKLPKWGEKETDAYTRFKTSIRRLGAMRDGKADQVILLCTHGDALAAWYESLDPGACVYEAAFCSYVMSTHTGDGVWKLEKSCGVGITT